MSKRMMSKAYLAALILIMVPFALRAETFDPEAISRVSKAIAEWKLMNENKAEEPPVYVSSSLRPIVQKDSSDRVGVVIGLSAFDDNYDWVQQDSAVTMTNTIRDTAIGITPIGPAYSVYSFGKTMWDLSNVQTPDDYYRATRGTPAWHVGAAVKILDNIEIPQLSTYQTPTPNYGSSDWSRFAVTTEKTIQLDGNSSITYHAIDWNATMQNMRENSILSNPSLMQNSSIGIGAGTWNNQTLNTGNWRTEINMGRYNMGTRIVEISPAPTYTYTRPIPTTPIYTPPPLPKIPTYTPPPIPSSSIERRY